MAGWASAADYAACCPGGSLAGSELDAALERASNQVDSACFGRIRRIGFDRLTPHQRACVVKAVCLHADWLAAYGDALDSPLASYGINGVSMAFDGNRTVQQGGVTLSGEAYSLLLQSGLAHRGIW